MHGRTLDDKVVNTKSAFCTKYFIFRRFIGFTMPKKEKKTKGDRFSEIRGDGYGFQDLVKAYFQALSNDKRKPLSVKEIDSDPTAVGSDGGKDILLTIRMNDSISNCERKWVVQCKFLDRNISPSHLWGTDIPTLLASHGADGYLLVCRYYPTEGTKQLFERLKRNTGYDYEIWTGNDLLDKLWPFSETIIKFKLPKLYAQINNH